jgi:hypothetical protein
MELILNVFWVLLALPAYWLWRRQTGTLRRGNSLSSWQCILVLGCILMLLFPVVSATDDLHVMRPEIEESSTSKRTLKHAATGKTFAWLLSPPIVPAVVTANHKINGAETVTGLVFVVSVARASSTSRKTGASRAPPSHPFA